MPESRPVLASPATAAVFLVLSVAPGGEDPVPDPPAAGDGSPGTGGLEGAPAR